MANHCQRTRRAAARAKKHDKVVATSVREMVPCVYGYDHKHPVVLELNADNQVVHVSSPCMANPPTPAEKAVTQGLIGDKYVCCATYVYQIRKQIADARRLDSMPSFQRQQSISKADDVALPALISITTAKAAKFAQAAQEKRAGNPRVYGVDEARDVAAFKMHSQRALFEALKSNLVKPHSWRVDIALPETGAGSGKPYPGPLTVSVASSPYSPWFATATYRGSGRFALLSRGIQNLVDYTCVGLKGDDGKVGCTVCGYRVTSMLQHTQSNRHKTQVERAVLTLCEQLGAKLKQRHWSQQR